MDAEVKRFATMACGKALALSVLLTSLSDQMSVVTGLQYFNADSFLACAVAAMCLVALVRWIRGEWFRVALNAVECLLVLVWICLLLYLQTAGGPVPWGCEVAYAFLGRIVVLFVNIQWNYRFALQSLDETSRSVIATVLLAVALFFVYLAVGGAASQFLIVGALLASAVLGLVCAWHEATRPDALFSSATVVREDGVHPVAVESRWTIRLLYFGSRMLYGLFLGILVCLTVVNGPSNLAVSNLAVPACILMLLGCALVAAGGLSVRGGYGAATLLPAVVTLVVYMALYREDQAGLLAQLALLAEVSWTTQNLLQLPSYRRICRLHPAVFAYGDYIAQIVPYYLTVWLLSTSGVLQGALDAWGMAPVEFGLGCFAMLTLFCMAAMARHIWQYVPRTYRDGDASSSEAREAYLVERARGCEVLTPRERDVFALMAAGYSRSYIAKVLSISPGTVKVHARHIYAKLGVESKDELIRFAQGGEGAVGGST